MQFKINYKLNTVPFWEYSHWIKLNRKNQGPVLTTLLLNKMNEVATPGSENTDIE